MINKKDKITRVESLAVSAVLKKCWLEGFEQGYTKDFRQQEESTKKLNILYNALASYRKKVKKKALKEESAFLEYSYIKEVVLSKKEGKLVLLRRDKGVINTLSVILEVREDLKVEPTDPLKLIVEKFDI